MRIEFEDLMALKKIIKIRVDEMFSILDYIDLSIDDYKFENKEVNEIADYFLRIRDEISDLEHNINALKEDYDALDLVF